MSSTSSLTPQGVADKLLELYALSDTQLKLQAAGISIDFRWWVRNNFDLTADQRLFLKNISNDAALYFGQQCAICFLHRLNINLIYPPPPIDPGYGKWTELLSSLNIGTDGNGALVVQGELTFEMIYKLQ